jgi:hypothetical protein
VDKPTTPTGKRLHDLASRLWEQPEDPKAPYSDPRSHSQARQIEVREMVHAIEAEATKQAQEKIEDELEWGSCPDNDGEPHRASLSLCVHCGEYDP